jgi:hypothetical protein
MIQKKEAKKPLFSFGGTTSAESFRKNQAPTVPKAFGRVRCNYIFHLIELLSLDIF